MFKVAFVDTLGWIKPITFITSIKDELESFLFQYGFNPMLDLETDYEEITEDGLSVRVEVK